MTASALSSILAKLSLTALALTAAGCASGHSAPSTVPAPSTAPTEGLSQNRIVFGNWIWDEALIDENASFFFTRAELESGMAEIDGFRDRNPYFSAWVASLDRPGLHVYGEGYPDDMVLVDRLLDEGKGWVCCLPLQGGVPATALKRGQPKAHPLPEGDAREFWLTPDGGFRIWPRPSAFVRPGGAPSTP